MEELGDPDIDVGAVISDISRQADTVNQSLNNEVDMSVKNNEIERLEAENTRQDQIIKDLSGEMQTLESRHRSDLLKIVEDEDTADSIDEFRIQRDAAEFAVRELQEVVDNITAANAEAAWEWKKKVEDRDTIIKSMKDGHAISELQSECKRHKDDLAKRDEEVLKYRAMRPLLQTRITETLEAHAKAAEGWKKEVEDRDKKIESMRKHMQKILQEQVDASDMQMQTADSALEDADEDADEV